LTGCAVAFWSTSSESASRFVRGIGMVHGTGVALVAERQQTAFRGRAPPPSGRGAVAPKHVASETSPCRRGGQSKTTASRRLDRERRLASAATPVQREVDG